MHRNRAVLSLAAAVMLTGMPLPQAHARQAASPAHAQCVSRAPAGAATSWLPPLDRLVTVDTSDVSLREGLEQVTRLSRLQLSYSAELLPSRRVCLALDRVPVGAALEAMLAGLPLRVMVVGASQLVLAPVRVSARNDDTVGFARNVSVLDRVVVTGSPDGATQRSSVIGLEVIDRATLQAHGVTGLGQVLELAVPGMWMWAPSPGAMTAQYGSIRGASSFGTSAPKIYLDGIEVANPLLVTQLDVSRVERIEVIRGPQGAALYGADAISGVVNIISRLDGTATGAPVVQVSSSAGVSQTAFAPRDAFVQQHALSIRGGQGQRSAGAGVSVSNVGAYVPGASELRVLADANGRMMLQNGMLTGTGRYSVQRASAAVSPLHASFGDSIAAQAMAQYTLGVTAALMPDPVWTLTAIAGVDGFRVNGLSSATMPLPLSVQQDAQSARGGADRFSFRLRGTARIDAAERTTLRFTLGAEQAMLRDASDGVVEVMSGDGQSLARTGVLQSQWATNSGVVAQADLAWRDMFYLVAGGRLEQTVGATPLPQTASMPMVGAAFVHDVLGATVKLRAGYGRGIRPAQTLLRGASWEGRAASDGEQMLLPESQAGTEFGTDIVWGNRLSLHVTRFDQRASGLIQPVSTQVVLTPRPGQPLDSLETLLVYVLENVGAIDNRGWEVEGNARLGAVSLKGWMSQVDSRVARVAGGYRGDLRAGDRPLAVPERTMSLSANWSGGRMQVGATVARASDWVGYDRVAIAAALTAPDGDATDLTGGQLRRFWRRYDGITRVRGIVSWQFSDRMNFQLAGENLLDIQRGAPDNATIVAGRTLTIGARTTF